MAKKVWLDAKVQEKISETSTRKLMDLSSFGTYSVPIVLLLAESTDMPIQHGQRRCRVRPELSPMPVAKCGAGGIGDATILEQHSSLK
jgi:hypothetical protein